MSESTAVFLRHSYSRELARGSKVIMRMRAALIVITALFTLPKVLLADSMGGGEAEPLMERNLYFESAIADPEKYLQDIKGAVSTLTPGLGLTRVSVLEFWPDASNPSSHLTVLHFAGERDLSLFKNLLDQTAASGDAVRALLDVVMSQEIHQQGQTTVLRSYYSDYWIPGQRMKVHAFTLQSTDIERYVQEFETAESVYRQAALVPDQVRLMSTGKASPSVTHYTLFVDANSESLETLQSKRLSTTAGRSFEQWAAESVTTRLHRNLFVVETFAVP